MLVTGAAGLVGAEVAAGLAEAGHTVLALTHTRPEIVRNNGRRVRTVPAGRAGPGRVARLTKTQSDFGVQLNYTYVDSKIQYMTAAGATSTGDVDDDHDTIPVTDL